MIRAKFGIKVQSLCNNFIKGRYFNTVSKKEDDIIYNRHTFLSPSLGTFTAYDDPLVLEKGLGCKLWDVNGNCYIDLVGQNLCISVGYSHPEVLRATKEQMNKLTHCTTMYYHEGSGLYAKELIDTLPPHPSGDPWVVHFVNSGSDAVDLCAQMARVYTKRTELFALHKSYHGLQGLTAGITAIGKATQSSYASSYGGMYHVSPNNITELRNQLTFNTGGKVAGMFIEPLQGYGGVFPLDKAYMKDAFELIHKYGGVTISDEVQTGFGRCGDAFWGFQLKNNDVIPDMLTIAKGMGGGVGIIGAVICRKAIAEAFAKKMFFNTYGGNPIAVAAGRAVLRTIQNENLRENCRIQGKAFKKGLLALCKAYPEIYKETRGRGLLQGLEIAGETPELSAQNAIKLHRRFRDRGIIIGRGSAIGNVFRIQPPMCITTEEVDIVLDSLREEAHKWVQYKKE